MAGKPRDVEREAVLSFRMPRALHEKLEWAAGGRSISEEMRRRLEASFELETDATTHRLVRAIAQLAADIEDAYAPWHEDRHAYDLFVQAFRELLAYSGPSKGEARPPRPGSTIGRLMDGRGSGKEEVSRAIGIAAAARERFL